MPSRLRCCRCEREGSGQNAVYRAASDEELGALSRLGDESGMDEMAGVRIYRNGPLTLEAEVKNKLADMRAECSDLRRRVEAFEGTAPEGAQRQQVVFCAGQCVLDRELGDTGDEDAEG